MDKLILPAGCTFEGEITAIANTGDIQIEAALTPARLHSEQGMISFKSSAAKVACEEITAPQGRVELEGEALAVVKLVATEAQIKANECELDELSLTGHLAIDSHDIVLGTLNAASATLSGDTIKGDLIEVEGELHLEANLTMVREIHAGKVVIHGSIDCKSLVAREGVTVATGNVAIKRLDAPAFEAAPEVTGIVVLATCKAVKAQGVRGFLHPNELEMLNDAAMAGGASAPLQARTRVTAMAPPEVRTVPAPPSPEPVLEPEPTLVAEAIDDAFEHPAAVAEGPSELVMDSAFEDDAGDGDDAYDAERAFAEAEAEFEAAPAPSFALGDGEDEITPLEDEIEEYDTVLLPQAPMAGDSEPVAAYRLEPAESEDEVVTALVDEDIEEINTAELMDHFDDMAELEDEAEVPFTVEDVAADPTPEPVEAIEQLSEEPIFDAFTEVYDTRDVTEPKLPNWGARRGNSGEFDTVALDPESLRNLSASFEAMPVVEDLPDPDFGVPDELEEPDHLSLPSLSAEAVEAPAASLAAAVDPVSADFLPGDLTDEAFEVVAAEEVDDFEDQVIEVPEELSPDELDDLSGTFDPDELEAISDSDFDDEVEDLNDELSADELDDTPLDELAEADADEPLEAVAAYEFDDVALPEIGEVEAYAFPDDDADGDDDPLGEAVQEAFDELEHSMEPVLDQPAVAEAALDPEEVLMRDLFAILDQLSGYFEEEYQPINQIHRYLEERRLNLFYKEGNRNAVLGSFDRHNNLQVSQLVRSFFQRLDQYREQYG